jgi:hypothetical protein
MKEKIYSPFLILLLWCHSLVWATDKNICKTLEGELQQVFIRQSELRADYQDPKLHRHNNTPFSQLALEYDQEVAKLAMLQGIESLQGKVVTDLEAVMSLDDVRPVDSALLAFNIKNATSSVQLLNGIDHYLKSEESNNPLQNLGITPDEIFAQLSGAAITDLLIKKCDELNRTLDSFCLQLQIFRSETSDLNSGQNDQSSEYHAFGSFVRAYQSMAARGTDLQIADFDRLLKKEMTDYPLGPQLREKISQKLIAMNRFLEEEKNKPCFQTTADLTASSQCLETYQALTIKKIELENVFADFSLGETQKNDLFFKFGIAPILRSVDELSVQINLANHTAADNRDEFLLNRIKQREFVTAEAAILQNLENLAPNIAQLSLIESQRLKREEKRLVDRARYLADRPNNGVALSELGVQQQDVDRKLASLEKNQKIFAEKATLELTSDPKSRIKNYEQVVQALYPKLLQALPNLFPEKNLGPKSACQMPAGNPTTTEVRTAFQACTGLLTTDDVPRAIIRSKERLRTLTNAIKQMEKTQEFKKFESCKNAIGGFIKSECADKFVAHTAVRCEGFDKTYQSKPADYMAFALASDGNQILAKFEPDFFERHMGTRDQLLKGIKDQCNVRIYEDVPSTTVSKKAKYASEAKEKQLAYHRSHYVDYTNPYRPVWREEASFGSYLVAPLVGQIVPLLTTYQQTDYLKVQTDRNTSYYKKLKEVDVYNRAAWDYTLDYYKEKDPATYASLYFAQPNSNIFPYTPPPLNWQFGSQNPFGVQSSMLNGTSVADSGFDFSPPRA